MTPLYRAKTVMVQGDQAEELGLLYEGLYTVDKGFQAPPYSTQTLVQLS